MRPPPFSRVRADGALGFCGVRGVVGVLGGGVFGWFFGGFGGWGVFSSFFADPGEKTGPPVLECFNIQRRYKYFFPWMHAL